MRKASSASVDVALRRLGATEQRAVADAVKPCVFRRKAVLVPRAEERCEYTWVRLPNGVTAMAVFDPSCDSFAAAACTIGVGHCSDPAAVPGLAHFLEHMAFLGSERFPVEGEYKSWIKQRGGACNASTGAEHTTYRLQIPGPHLPEALDRMGDAIRAPLLRPDAAGREVRAVDSEFRRNYQNDGRRLFQAKRALARPGSPWRRFGTGNATSLTGPGGDEAWAVARLREFWDKHYRGPLMTVAVVSSDPLQRTCDLIETAFGPVRPASGVASSSLRSRSLATALSAGTSSTSGFSELSVSITLTELGDANRELVLSLLFLACARLRAADKAELWRCWDELALVRAAAFAFRESPSAMSQAVGVSRHLQHWSADLALAGPSLVGPVDEKGVEACLAALGPANSLIVHLSPVAAPAAGGAPVLEAELLGFGPEASPAGPAQPLAGTPLDLREEWYDTPLAQRAVAAERLAAWGASPNEADRASQAAAAAIAADPFPGRTGSGEADADAEGEAEDDLGAAAERPAEYAPPLASCEESAILASLAAHGVVVSDAELRLPRPNPFLPKDFSPRTATAAVEGSSGASEGGPVETDPSRAPLGRRLADRHALLEAWEQPRPAAWATPEAFVSALEADAMATAVHAKTGEASGPSADDAPAQRHTILGREAVRVAAARSPPALLVARLGRPLSDGDEWKAARPAGHEGPSERVAGGAGACVWHRPGSFDTPRASVTAFLRFEPEVCRTGDAAALACRTVGVAALQEALSPALYEAQEAGYVAHVGQSTAGIVVVVSGFSEHLRKVLDLVLSECGRVLAEALADTGGFGPPDCSFARSVARQRELLQRRIISRRSANARDHAVALTTELLHEAHVDDERMLPCVATITAAQAATLLRAGLDTARADVLVHGDATRADAVALGDALLRGIAGLRVEAEGGASAAEAPDAGALRDAVASSSWASPEALKGRPYPACSAAVSLEAMPVEAGLPLSPSRPPVVGGVPSPRSLLLPAGRRWRRTRGHPNPKDVNSSVVLSVLIDVEALQSLPWHGGPVGSAPAPSLAARACALRVLAMRLIEQPFFHALRTQQQLGYVVRASVAGNPLTAPRLTFTAQSSWATPDDIESRIRAFLAEEPLVGDCVRRVLAPGGEPDAAALAALRQGVVRSLMQADSRQAEERARLAGVIARGETAALFSAEVAAAVMAATPRDVEDFARAFVVEGATLRRELCSRVRSTNPDSPASRLGTTNADGTIDPAGHMEDDAPPVASLSSEGLPGVGCSAGAEALTLPARSAAARTEAAVDLGFRWTASARGARPALGSMLEAESLLSWPA
ncbi:hypothetical protein FNF29_00242 [Cafeteria roenbergensis]|uniref:Peptidase M16 N-terminal domain-containing protein n=1 Tax=Cafeteria roenbergensis TaxID=33653 RepID=A0A5A8CZ56_CAFRO|nr:hypothetical protein FNF29_00242 [Cafeteria roenbergensis]|eukprot:KAA0157667.1 hypothetical protein FNF29_00242 [Cafeteria roenbergensis]